MGSLEPEIQPSFPDNIVRIEAEEFIQCCDWVVATPVKINADTVNLEPGFAPSAMPVDTGNPRSPKGDSSSHLVMIQSPVSELTSETKARTSFLSPHFEEGRENVGMLFLRMRG